MVKLRKYIYEVLYNVLCCESKENMMTWHDRNPTPRRLMAHPVCAAVNNAMQQLTGVQPTAHVSSTNT